MICAARSRRCSLRTAGSRFWAPGPTPEQAIELAVRHRPAVCLVREDAGGRRSARHVAYPAALPRNRDAARRHLAATCSKARIPPTCCAPLTLRRAGSARSRPNWPRASSTSSRGSRTRAREQAARARAACPGRPSTERRRARCRLAAHISAGPAKPASTPRSDVTSVRDASLQAPPRDNPRRRRGCNTTRGGR